MLEYQLRIYHIRPGTMADFIEGWRTHVVPIREQQGFKILHAFEHAPLNEFVWLLSWEGDEGFAAADAAYAASPARQELTWDPHLYIQSMELRILKSVPFQLS